MALNRKGIMMPPARLTVHARDKVVTRGLHVTDTEVADILDTDPTVVLLGYEPGSSRMHRLFYSAPDEACFVAVQDEKTGDVITILPPDFDGRCKVSSEAIHELLRAHGRLPPSRASLDGQNKKATQPISKNARSIIFHMHFRSQVDRKLVHKKVRVSSDEYSLEVPVLEKDGRILEMLREQVRMHTSAELHFEDVVVSLGQNARPQSFSFEV